MREYIIFVYRLGNGKMNSRAGFFQCTFVSSVFLLPVPPFPFITEHF